MANASRTLGKYHIVRELGRGSFGVVYLAEDTTLDNRRVALKVLYPQLVVDPETLGLFHREAGTTAHLDHPHIAAVYEAGDAEERRFIAMRYVPGRTLAQLLHDEGPPPLERVAAWLGQVASALDYAHAQGVLHRDVKPSNILLDRDGRAVVTDFGLAKAVSSSGGSTGSQNKEIMSGTARYMAPEQAKGKPVPQSDIYSLGVVVYELLTGQVPFDGDDPFAIAIRHMTEEPRPPRELRPDLPDPVEAVVLRALAKQPADRWQSAGDMADAFRLAVRAAATDQQSAAAQKQGTTVRTQPLKQPAAERRHGPNMPTWAWAVIGMLVLSLVVGVVAIGSRLWNGSTPTPAPGGLTAVVGVAPTLQPASASPSQTSPTNTISPTATPTTSPSPTATPTETPTATNTPTTTPSTTPTATDTPTATPSTTPTVTDTPTATPSPRPTSTRTKTPTRVPTPTPTKATYPPPVLVEPNAGASLSQPTTLRWKWTGTLSADEFFDVRVWRQGEPHNGVAWTKQSEYLYDPKIKGGGTFYWAVAVIRGQGGKWLANLSPESPARQFTHNAPYGAAILLPSGLSQESPIARADSARGYLSGIATCVLLLMLGFVQMRRAVRRVRVWLTQLAAALAQEFPFFT